MGREGFEPSTHENVRDRFREFARRRLMA